MESPNCKRQEVQKYTRIDDTPSFFDTDSDKQITIHIQFIRIHITKTPEARLYYDIFFSRPDTELLVVVTKICITHLWGNGCRSLRTDDVRFGANIHSWKRLVSLLSVMVWLVWVPRLLVSTNSGYVWTLEMVWRRLKTIVADPVWHAWELGWCLWHWVWLLVYKWHWWFGIPHTWHRIQNETVSGIADC